MKRHLAHALRRTARKLIGWSNRLDAPAVTSGVRWAYYHNNKQIGPSEYEALLQGKDYGRLTAQFIGSR